MRSPLSYFKERTQLKKKLKEKGEEVSRFARISTLRSAAKKVDKENIERKRWIILTRISQCRAAIVGKSGKVPKFNKYFYQDIHAPQLIMQVKKMEKDYTIPQLKGMITDLRAQLQSLK